MWFQAAKAKASTSQASAGEDPREAKRKRLEQERQERLLRAQQRDQLQKRLQAAQAAQEEANQAFQDLLAIAPDIFEGDISGAGEVSEDILDESLEAEIMADFDKIDGKDGDKALDKMSSVQVPYDANDLEYWFSEVEGQLELIDVQSQWYKRMALQKLLPLEVKEEVKTLLRLSKTQAGNDIYFRLKQELLELFGKRPEDDYTRAKNRLLTGKPSQLGKALIDDICKKEKKLDGCCCHNTVWAMFRDQLPIVIRNHISRMKFSKDTYKEIFQAADQVWASNQAPEPAAAARPTVAAIKQDQAPSDPAAVAAVTSNGPRRKPKKNQNQSNAATTSSKPATTTTTATSSKPKGTRHATAKGKDENLCKIHFSWGVNATYCAAPWKCPMKDTWKAPQ